MMDDDFKPAASTLIPRTSLGNPTSAPPTQGAQTAAHNYLQEEARAFHDGRGRQKRGRAPSLYRAEVDAIKRDGRPVAKIAREYGVSHMTIRRVKEIGMFAGVPYVPADEYERIIPARQMTQYDKRQGRPLKRGREFTNEEIQFIISCDWTLDDLAHHFTVSRSTIGRLQQKWRGWFPKGQRLEEIIRADPRQHHEIARQYLLSEHMVRQIQVGKNPFIYEDDELPQEVNDGDD